MSSTLIVPENSGAKIALRHEEGGFALSVNAEAGLHQFSVVAEARDFDWEELYIEMNAFGNSGQRTGPWDFHPLRGNVPLVPSYWVFLNGRKIGLWFFQRVSPADIAAQCFRGRMAFHVEKSGPLELRWEPYRPLAVRWTHAHLEPDPEDTLRPQTEYSGPLPATRWGEPSFWCEKREQLQTSHAIFQEPLRRVFDGVLQKTAHGPNDLLLLLAAHCLEEQPGARDAALRAMDMLIAQPHWGNPKEDGYGHNGDMRAAIVLRALAWSVHAWRDELGAKRRARLLEKLTLQGERFFEAALLNRDYWGGSLLQDHGWQSFFDFGTAALHLRGLLPSAEKWLAYVLPRIRRAVEAMPRDGVIPESSYGLLYLYLDNFAHFRDALLAHSGEDIFDTVPVREIVDYVLTVLRPRDHLMLAGLQFVGGDCVPFIGGGQFFHRLAAKHRDGRAAALSILLLQTPLDEFPHPRHPDAFAQSVLHGFLSFDPSVVPVETLPLPAPLTHFEDSGLAYYRDLQNDITLSVRCGPTMGHHAYRHATGPCDRIGGAPGAGHFVLARGATPLLTTPDQGYRLNSALRSCLLVDGRGQHDDIGYPMSIPSKIYRGEAIEAVHWDEATSSGRIRLNLTSAYPPELGVQDYSREFLIDGKKIVCRDVVALREPRQLSWLFQAKRKTGLTLDDLVFCFGAENGVRLQARASSSQLRAAICPTEVVWSYSSLSGFEPFDHARYDTREAVESARVEFVFTW